MSKADSDSTELDEVLLRRAEALQKRGVFLGGPLKKFARVGKNQLSALRREGLRPDCNVLDVGCGCLRGGFWIMQYLEPGHYFGIEPNVSMLDAGIQGIVTGEVVERCRPVFDHNDQFDFDVFGVSFHYVIARSIWTHAHPGQIEHMLDQSVATSQSGSVFLTSIRECEDAEEQYSGTVWVGRSHESNQPGVIAYSMSWISALCSTRGLRAERLGVEFDQTWLRISR